MPHKIRSTPALNSFFANLPHVLDNNYDVGKAMLTSCVLILQKIPFPPRYATFWLHGNALLQETSLYQGCGYSLWYLEPSVRRYVTQLHRDVIRLASLSSLRNWLLSALVIFYKHHFNCDSAMGERMLGLVKIVLHTLSSHSHVCDRTTRPTVTSLARYN